MTVPLPSPQTPLVLVLGAGINGCSVARELILNRVPVIVADRSDIASGATSKSSRLIHGGLRYLEFGDFGLVHESLVERSRLLRLAPQFVRPLKLFIPVQRRRGGLLQAAIRFLQFERIPAVRRLARRLPTSQRGLWAARIGLTLYDWLAGDDLPRHSVFPATQAGTPGIDRHQFRWLCAYFDAQMLYPERFTLALLEDCRRAAAERGVSFQVFTYCSIDAADSQVTLRPGGSGAPVTVRPSVVVNATGAWGDDTLRQLHADAPPLFAGTKGSHIITRQPALLAALGEDAVYAEAADGRLVFVLPFADSVLIGTTDIPYHGPPDEAVASPEEIRYLVDIVNEVFPDVALSETEIDAHYCGVRPLPNAPASRPWAIPRGHTIATHEIDGIPVDTLIGGKLTTCRALGEQAADRILQRLGIRRSVSTRNRIVPGAEEYPHSPELQTARIAGISRDTGFSVEQVAAVWQLVGTRASEILRACSCGERTSVSGTALPIAFVDWVIRNEWVSRLEDLVERRLMLAWDPALTPDSLRELAECLLSAHVLAGTDLEAAVASARERLARHYGRHWCTDTR